MMTQTAYSKEQLVTQSLKGFFSVMTQETNEKIDQYNEEISIRPPPTPVIIYRQEKGELKIYKDEKKECSIA